MTCKERLEKEHPERISTMYVGECLGCPHEMGYAGKPPWCPGDKSSIEAMEACTKCWNRHILEEHDPELEPRILDSGNRREFETGAVRDIQEGKGRCDLLPLDVVAEYLDIATNSGYNTIIARIDKFIKTSKICYLYDALVVFTEQHWENDITMLLEVAKHFEEGCKKYGENNWQKGIPVHCYIDSAVRHYLKFLRGDKDEPHDRAFCWNILCAIWTCKHKPELNEYGKGVDEIPVRPYDPVAKAYDILVKVNSIDNSDYYEPAVTEAIGYLGEALE